MPMPIRNTSDLRAMLIATIEEVRSGKIDCRQAATIAKLTTTVLASAKIDLEYLRFQSGGAGTGEKRALELVAADASKTA